MSKLPKYKKVIGRKNYGSIGHLPESRMGPGDHSCNKGQARIATEKKRDKLDHIIVQEKIDGSNVGVARIDDVLYPIGRAGYPAISSPYEQHKYFHKYVHKNYERFMTVIKNGERIVGEWIMQAHGTKYNKNYLKEPFFVFDIMDNEMNERMPHMELIKRVSGVLSIPYYTFTNGEPVSVNQAVSEIDCVNYHFAMSEPEGAVWRVERDKPTGNNGEKVRVVDFIVKYVKPNKIDGCFLPEKSGPGQGVVWNWTPEDLRDAGMI